MIKIRTNQGPSSTTIKYKGKHIEGITSLQLDLQSQRYPKLDIKMETFVDVDTSSANARVLIAGKWISFHHYQQEILPILKKREINGTNNIKCIKPNRT